MSDHSRVKNLFLSTTFLGGAIAVLTFGTFLGVLSHGFVSFDDDIYISENPYVQGGLNAKSIKWALSADLFFDSPHADMWIPATFLSHIVTAEVFGMDPRGHHLVNVLIHIVNSIFLFLLLDRMTRARLPAFLVALLFAVHPAHVESVAWVTERKDVLSTFFLFSAVWTYLRYVEKRGFSKLLPVMIFFILAVTAKPAAVVIPALLLLIDCWPLGRISFSGPGRMDAFKKGWGLILEKWPLFLLALGFAAVTVLTVGRGGTLASVGVLSLWDRLGNALFSYMSYLLKMAWPANLAVFYPHPGDTLPGWKVFLAGIGLAGITGFFLKEGGARPYLAVGWFWYLVSLLPMIGLIQAGDQGMADRYTYVPFIGIFIILIWGLREAAEKMRVPGFYAGAASGILVALFVVLSVNQLQYWRNSVTLLERALDVSGDHYKIHLNLGNAYGKQGSYPEAIAHYEKVLMIEPNIPDAYNNLGLVYAAEGNTDLAIRNFQIALSLFPGNDKYHINLGEALAGQGRLVEANEAYRSAVRLRPESIRTRFLLATSLLESGFYKEAIEEFRKTLALDPGHAWARNYLGEALFQMGDYEGAAAEFKRVTELKPGMAEGHNNLAGVYLQTNRLDLAVRGYETAFSLKPVSSIAFNLGLAYQGMGRFGNARRYFQEALKIDPDFLPAREALGRLPNP